MNGLHTRAGWYSFARTCHDAALSHCVHPEAALTHTDPFVVGGAERATCKDIRSRISAAALVRRCLRQPMHGLHGRPRETAHYRRPKWVADRRNPAARDHLWHPAAGSVYTNSPSAVVHLNMSLRSSLLIGDHLFDFGATAVACACCVYVFSPHVRILGLLLGLTQAGKTGGATSNTCCLNARVLWAREARWRLHFSGMTSLRRVLDLSMHRRCCLQRFLLIVPLLWLPRLVSSRSSSTLLLHWDVPRLGA